MKYTVTVRFLGKTFRVNKVEAYSKKMAERKIKDKLVVLSCEQEPSPDDDVLRNLKDLFGMT